jgi:hypothetical protein
VSASFTLIRPDSHWPEPVGGHKRKLEHAKWTWPQQSRKLRPDKDPTQRGRRRPVLPPLFPKGMQAQACIMIGQDKREPDRRSGGRKVDEAEVTGAAAAGPSLLGSVVGVEVRE